MKTLNQIIEQFGGTADDWKQHANGGGWVHRDVTVKPEVFVGPGAALRRGTFLGGTFRGGVFWGGTFRGGVFWGGTFRGGEFWGGTFRGGAFWGGEFWGGTFEGGEFRGGTFEGGEFWGGTFHGGTFEGGEFRGGTFEGGEFWGGVFSDGTFRGGTFRGGDIEGGTWDRQPVTVLGSRHVATNSKPGYIKIGCRCEPFAWWTTPEAEEFAIDNGYTEAQREEYRRYVKFITENGR